MYGLMGDPKYLTSIFLRSNFTQFMTAGSDMMNQSIKQNTSNHSKMKFSEH